MPPYTVEATDGRGEIRAYGPHLLAEVTASGQPLGRDPGAGSACWRAISSAATQTGEKIAMTVPVAQTPQAGRQLDRQLHDARRLHARDPARPAHRRDPLCRGWPPRRVVVERFSGLPSDSDDLAARRPTALRPWAEGRA